MPARTAAIVIHRAWADVVGTAYSCRPSTGVRGSVFASKTPSPNTSAADPGPGELKSLIWGGTISVTGEPEERVRRSSRSRSSDACVHLEELRQAFAGYQTETEA